MKALVLTFDRLAIRFLGCYGNNWVETPGFDFVASESVLFENHYIENVNTDSANHPWWSGRRSFDNDERLRESKPSPFEILKSSGVSLHAVVEDEANAPKFPLQNFEHVVEVASSEELFDCSMKEFDLLEKEDSWLMWVKSKGIAFPCFPADESLRLFLEDDEIEAAQENVARFAQWHNENRQQVSFNDVFSTDDERMLHLVYAACVYELDLQLGMLWERLSQQREEDLLMVLAAARGEWLGEPLPDSHPECKICESVIHTPLMVFYPNIRKSVRLPQFVQPVDFLPTIFDWFGVSSACEFEGVSFLDISRNSSPSHSHYFCHDDGQCLSVGSKDFFLRTHGDSFGEDDMESAELYHSPEDIWLVNDVGNQWPKRRKELWQILRKLAGNN